MYYRGIPLYTEYRGGSPELWPLVCQQNSPSVSILTGCEHATLTYIHTYVYVHVSQSTLVQVSLWTSIWQLSGWPGQPDPNPTCLCDHPCPPYTYCVCSREDAGQLISENVPIQYVEILISSIAYGSGYTANCTKESVRPFYVSKRFNYR